MLESRPAQAEASLAYVGLGDLLRDVVDEALEPLAPPQADALRTALLLDRTPGASPDERGVAVAFLGALRALAERQPLLVAVDDAQWLDTSSAFVLAFAWRRVRSERVGLLLARRPGRGSPLQLAGDDRIVLEPLGPLSLGALHSMLHARLGLTLTRPRLRRVHEVSGGNPFFALELARSYADERDGVDLPPMPARLRVVVGERLAALPQRTQSALAAVAALSRPTLGLVVTAAGGEEPLRPAFDAGVLELEGERVRFSHPLLASRAYEAAGPLERRHLHRFLATLVDDEAERWRHEALAAAGPDAAIAAGLDRAAAAQRARGAAAAAADLCAQARRLTPADDAAGARRRRLTEAHYRWAAGDAAGASTLLERAVRMRPPAASAPRRWPALHASSPSREISAAPSSWLRRARRARCRRCRAHRRRARTRMGHALPARGSRAEARAARPSRRSWRSAAATVRCWPTRSVPRRCWRRCSGARRRRRRSRRRWRWTTSPILTRIIRSPEFDRSLFLIWTDRCAEAADLLRRFHVAAIEAGEEGSIALTAAQRGLADTGSATGPRPPRWRPRPTSWRCRPASGRSRRLRCRCARSSGPRHDGEARADAGSALALAGDAGMAAARLHATWALGLLELSLERPAEVVELLAPERERLLAGGVGEPGSMRFVADEVEALIALGSPEEAQRVLAGSRSAQPRRASALAAAARCRGLLAAARGDGRAALAAFEQALAAHARRRGRSSAPARSCASVRHSAAAGTSAPRARRSKPRARSSSASARRSGANGPSRSSSASVVAGRPPMRSRRRSAGSSSSWQRAAPTSRSLRRCS